MRVLGGLADRLHGRDRDPLEPLEPDGRRLALEAFLHERGELLAVRDARRVRREALVVGELESSRELGEQPVVRRGEHDLSVERLEHLVRRDVRERGAVLARLVARERVGDVVAGERERGLEERDLDHVPLARLQRGEDPDRRPPRRRVVDQGHADAHGRAAGLARDREEAGERLHQRVVAGLVAERAPARTRRCGSRCAWARRRAPGRAAPLRRAEGS